jgi:VCBS repeat-containing protein
LVLTYAVQSADNANTSDTQSVTVTINGSADAPIAHDDASSATEQGGTSNGSGGSNASGNVLGNDTDADAGSTLVVTSLRTGSTEGAGTPGVLGAALVGAHGTLTLNANGSYSYVVNDSDAAVQALNVGQTLTDSFNYTASDGGLSDTAMLTVTINGADDAPTNIDFSAIAPPSDTTLPGANTALATLSSDDVDNSGFTYNLVSSTLVSGTAASFAVSGNTVSTDTIGLSVNSKYSLVISSTDAGGLSVSETLNIVTGTNTTNSQENIGTSGSPTSNGDDIIYALNSGNGTNQHDVVFAGSGDDNVFGQGGKDDIHGGLGNDILSGGGGNDTFYFDTALNAATNVDTVTDFDAANADSLFLSKAVFTALGTASGTLGTGDFGAVADGTGASAALGAGVHIIYDSQTGNLYYDADGGNTASGRTLFAVLGTSTHPSTALFNNGDITVGA